MKYNRHLIMKRAWEIRRSYSVRALTFSECLKKAWSEAKTEYQNSLVPNEFTNGMDITVDGYTRTLNRWQKGNMDRVYINGGSRKGDGFVDIKTGKFYLRGNLSYQIKIAEKIVSMNINN